MERLSRFHPELSGVKVHICKKIATQTTGEFDFELKPESPEIQYESCPNPNCTSRFDITFLIKEAILRKKTLSGQISCDGKLSAKYLKHQHQTCDGALEYEIIPVFREGRN
ncbi:MAG: hypothetical protein LBK58_00695 [Prevotellaceae bacterium]|jgi:hypothetical protein|nr:hypothetical protein [Prevotellaceae bacterium]